MYQVSIDGSAPIQVSTEQDQLTINGESYSWDIQPIPNGGYSILANNKSYELHVESLNYKDKQATVLINNRRYTLAIQEPIDLLLAKMGINLSAAKKVEVIKAPMPGLVLKIMVEEGQVIKKGDPVLILEAMKMENVFKAPADATVKAIKIQAGTAVEKGTVLIELA